MNLSIVDLRSVLKTRVNEVIGRNATEDPVGILAGVKDIRVVLDEMETLANSELATREQLKNESETSN